MPDRYAALLRGINLGGRRIPMKDLAGIFTDAGCKDVETYIQSGNVVFAANAALVKRIPAIIPAAISRKFKFDVPVIVRSAAEMKAITRNNPFMRRKCDVTRLHVVFLSSTPTKAQIEALDPDRSPPDEFVVRGSEIYLHLPNGAARSKLTNQYFDSRLKTISSNRNWNTVTTLLDMMTR